MQVTRITAEEYFQSRGLHRKDVMELSNQRFPRISTKGEVEAECEKEKMRRWSSWQPSRLWS